MPSRTYIQMILKLHKNGKLFLAKKSLLELSKYNTVLENHPESIEEIVQRRVNMQKYAKTICPNIDIMIVHMVIFEKVILDSMFMAELIEPVMFDDFDIKPTLIPNYNRIAMGFEPVMSNAIVTVDWGGKNETT